MKLCVHRFSPLIQAGVVKTLTCVVGQLLVDSRWFPRKMRGKDGGGAAGFRNLIEELADVRAKNVLSMTTRVIQRAQG